MALKSKHGAGGEYARAWQPSVRRTCDHICTLLTRSVCAGDAVAGVRAPAAARAVRGGIPARGAVRMARRFAHQAPTRALDRACARADRAAREQAAGVGTVAPCVLPCPCDVCMLTRRWHSESATPYADAAGPAADVPAAADGPLRAVDAASLSDLSLLFCLCCLSPVVWSTSVVHVSSHISYKS
jgi:hypothetical protein